MASRIIVFGGQGSKALFSPLSVASLREALKRSPAASLFLAKCHLAWLHAIESLDDPSRTALHLETLHFYDAQSLLDPPQVYTKHGVVIAASLFTAQLIHFISCSESGGRRLQTPISNVLEATGFCAGLLPAVAISCSDDLGQLIDVGVELFRLCFWIAVRSTHSAAIEGGETGTWSMVVSGITEQKLEAAMADFSTKTGCHTLQISAVSAAETLSLSAPARDLEMFRQSLHPSTKCSLPAVFSWYHGGHQLSRALALVKDDIEKQNIRVPSSSELRTTVRSTFDDEMVTRQSEPQCMGLWIARHMILYRVNWPETMEAIKMKCLTQLNMDELATIEVESYGPGASSLLSGLKDLHRRIHTVGRSSSGGAYDIDAYQADSIAIVGMSIRVPGANNPDEFAELLLAGRNIVQEIPLDRFDVSPYRPDSTSGKRQMNACHGAFLDDVWTFDNSFFSISPREAVSMDPQQRLLLHATQTALDHAGYVPDSTPSFQRSTMGCYIGLATGDYTDNLCEQIDVFYSPGTLRAFHSGRISYSYKMSGPCMTIDTACSSSSVSISQACKAIQSGDCTSAIAGGVNVICSPDMQLGLDRGHFLSSTGGCKPFDASADGYCRAEGVVVFVLKKLSDAIAENDNIHGILRGSVINQSGNSHSITHPHSPTQVELMKSLLNKTGISAQTIEVIEAHGTGTQAGDTREHESLATVFEQSHSSSNPLTVSSVKGNIGHAEAASGGVGLTKLLLMMRNQVIYKQANLTAVNPRIPAGNQQVIKIPVEPEPWTSKFHHPRRAVLNNFGAAGSNCALLVEQAEPASDIKPKSAQRSAYVFSLSAKSPSILRESIQEYLACIESQKFDLRDICYTATARRPSYDHAATAVVTSVHELAELLEPLAASPGVKTSGKSSSIFAFSGQGAIYAGMGEELMKTSPVFANLVGGCNATVTGLGFPDILAFLNDNGPHHLDPNDGLIVSQCACVALQYALAMLMLSWGMLPNCVVGHSLGEFAALAICGALSIEEVMVFVARRASLMALNCAANVSAMLVVKVSAKSFIQILHDEGLFKELEIACVNSPSEIVAAGSNESLEVLEEKLAARSIKSKRLNVAFGYHSSFMDPILAELEELSCSLKWNEPKIPFYSTVLGELVHFTADGRGLGSDYLSRHCRQTVMFSAAIQSIDAGGLFEDSSCLEIGPHPILSAMVQSSKTGPCVILPTLQRGKDPWLTLCGTLSSLSTIQGVKILWREVFAGSDAKLVDLPGYPLRGSRYAVTYTETHSTGPSKPANDSLLRLSAIFRSSQKLEVGTVFRTSTEIIGRLIAGHDVAGTPICPASVFWMLATESARIVFEPDADQIIRIEEMGFASPFVLHVSGDEPQDVECMVLQTDSDGRSRFEIRSTGLGSEASCHCSGYIRPTRRDATAKAWAREGALVKRQINYLHGLQQHRISRFQTRILYDVVFPRVVQYALEYQSLTDFSISYESQEGLGSFQLPRSQETDSVCEQLARWTDVLFHAAGFIANTSQSTNDVYICAQADEVTVQLSHSEIEEVFHLYCSLLNIEPGAVSADAYATTKSGQIVASCKSMVFKRVRRTKFLSHISSLHRPGSKSQVEQNDDNTPSLTMNGGQISDDLITVNSSPITSPEQTVLEALSMVSGIAAQHLQHSMSLEHLGIDSMIQIELVQKLKQVFPLALDHGALESLETVGEVVEAVRCSVERTSTEKEATSDTSDAEMTSKTVSMSSSSSIPGIDAQELRLLALQVTSEKKTPLILFPDGSGLAKPYSRMHDIGRNLYAAFDDSSLASSFSSIREVATAFASMISSTRQPSLILCGWSFGGIVALETAYQLLRLGQQVHGLILIDAPYPVKHTALPNEIIAHILTDGELSTKQPNAVLMARFQHAAQLLGQYVPPEDLGLSNFPCTTVMLQSAEVFDAKAQCGVDYSWLSSQGARKQAIKDWETLLGGEMKVLGIPGNHFQPFRPENIGKTSEQIAVACEYIDVKYKEGSATAVTDGEANLNSGV